MDPLGLFDVRMLTIVAELLYVSQTLMLLLLESENRDRLQQYCASVLGLLGLEGDGKWSFPADWMRRAVFCGFSGSCSVWHVSAFPYWPEWGSEKPLH